MARAWLYFCTLTLELWIPLVWVADWVRCRWHNIPWPYNWAEYRRIVFDAAYDSALRSSRVDPEVFEANYGDLFD